MTGHVIDLDRARQQQREPPVIAGRVPPHELHAEAAVLSAVLLETAAIDVVRGVLEEQHFYSEPNRLIYRAVVEIHKAEQPVDVVTVASWLRKRELIARVDVTYLGRIVDATPAVANVLAHAWIVVTCWRQRRVIATMQGHTAEGYHGVGDVDAWLERVRASMLETTQHDRVSLELLGDGYRELLRDLDTTTDATTDAKLGLTTEIPDLDEAIGGLRAPDVYVLVAEAGGGKTALALSWALRTALDGRGVYYWNGEPGQPKRELLQRAAAREARVDFGLIRNNAQGLSSEDWVALRGAEAALTAAPLLVDDRKQLHADQIVSACHHARRRLKERSPELELELVVLDNFSELSAPPGTNPRATIKSDWLESSARTLLKLGQVFNVPVVLLAHLKKGTNEVYYCPRLKSLAQNLIRIRLKKGKGGPRPATGDLPAPLSATLDVQRQRNGAPAQIACWFHGALQRFSDEEYPR